MKIKSLLLGSIAAAGFSTGAFAADLNVLTSLDVCDALGISGLTISSDTNCLQITGEAKYEFSWGDYSDDAANHVATTLGGNKGVMAGGGAAGLENDWLSKVDAYLKFVGTADSDFGPASVTIKFDYDNDTVVENELYTTGPNGSTLLRMEEAYTSVGDSTVIMAGQKGSIFKNGDDDSLTWLKPYNYDAVDTGVETPFTDRADGGPTHVIQVVSDLGNGVSVGAGLENLNGSQVAGVADDGNFVGFIEYAGDGITAHASIIGGGFLDGAVEDWGMHAGFTGEFDNFKLVAALAADNTNEWNALVSASATFDMFTLAATVEATSGLPGAPATGDQWGGSLSGSAEVSDGITINVGFRWFDNDSTTADSEVWQAAAALVAAVTETVTVTGELGVHGETVTDTTVTYGSVELAWAPGGDYKSSLKGEINSASAYKITYKASKKFQ